MELVEFPLNMVYTISLQSTKNFLSKCYKKVVFAFVSNDICGMLFCVFFPIDTYVKLTLLNSMGQEMSKCKTSIRRGQPNPVYKETFVFQVALFQLSDVTLILSVYNKRSMKRKEMIGWISLGLNSSGEEELNHWTEMKESKGQQVCRWHALLESWWGEQAFAAPGSIAVSDNAAVLTWSSLEDLFFEESPSTFYQNVLNSVERPSSTDMNEGRLYLW